MGRWNNNHGNTFKDRRTSAHRMKRNFRCDCGKTYAMKWAYLIHLSMC